MVKLLTVDFLSWQCKHEFVCTETVKSLLLKRLRLNATDLTEKKYSAIESQKPRRERRG